MPAALLLPHWNHLHLDYGPVLRPKPLPPDLMPGGEHLHRIVAPAGQRDPGQSPVSGSVRGSEVRFAFSVESEGQFYLVVYAGTIDEERRIIGTMDIGGGLVLGTFTAARSDR